MNGTKTTHVWDGSNIVMELDGSDNILDKYIRGINLIKNNTSYFLYNAHGDVVHLTDSAGAVTKRYHYDAFGNEVSPSAGDGNPWRYCGEYFDGETGTVYLRARYYDPRTGRFGTEDPVRDGLNWYTYCVNNPLMFLDPWGLAPVNFMDYVTAMGATTKNYTNKDGKACVTVTYNGVSKNYILNGGWIEDYKINPVFGWGNNDTEKIINDAYVRIYKTSDQNERVMLISIANNARAMQNAGTPYMFGNDAIKKLLHENAQAGLNLYSSMDNIWYIAFGGNPYKDAFTWLVFMHFRDQNTGDPRWDYKWDPNWQIPESYPSDFYGIYAGAPNARNWYEWIYFEGVMIGADKVANINWGYVGTKMGYGGLMLFNAFTTGGNDDVFIQMGVNLANKGY